MLLSYRPVGTLSPTSLQVPAPRLLRLLPRGVVAEASSTDATPASTSLPASNAEFPADDNKCPVQPAYICGISVFFHTF